MEAILRFRSSVGKDHDSKKAYKLGLWMGRTSWVLIR